MAPEEDDRKAKDVLQGELDPATRADLERWFGLPSYAEAAEKNLIPDDDPDVIAVRERREKAIAAVDPALLEAHRKRTEPPMELFKLAMALDAAGARVEPEIALFDFSMIERAGVIAEPREIEISEDLRDDLKDCTPQAILRDLHRVVEDFDKTFEMIDFGAEQRLDIVLEVATAMATSWKLPPLEALPGVLALQTMKALRDERSQPWATWFKAQPLPNRKWSVGEDQ